MLNVTRADDGALAYTNPDGHYFIASGDFANCTLPACPVELSVYGYRASLPFSALAIALFGLCAAVQIFLCVRFRTWSFMVAMLLGCGSEIIGYIGRILMWQNPWDDAGFIMQIGTCNERHREKSPSDSHPQYSSRSVRCSSRQPSTL